MVSQPKFGPSSSETQLVHSLSKMEETSNNKVDACYLDQLPKTLSSPDLASIMAIGGNPIVNPKCYTCVKTLQHQIIPLALALDTGPAWSYD